MSASTASSHFSTLKHQLRISTTMPATRKKTVADLADADLKGKKVLVRADLNVPLDVSSCRMRLGHK